MSSFSRGIFMPFSTIRFRHFYFVDVAQSFAFSISNVIQSDNKYVKLALSCLTGIFPLIRICQCMKRYSTSKLMFPHIFNALKYAMGMVLFTMKIMVDLTGKNGAGFTFKATVIMMYFLNSLISLMWDIFVDFSIVRSRFMFPRFVYMWVIFYDIVCRFVWIIDVFNILDHKYGRELKVSVSLAEILRRFLWTLVRVEVEHLNNCQELTMNKVLKLTSGELFFKKDQEQPKNIEDESLNHLTTCTENETIDSIDVAEETAYDTSIEE